MKSDKLMDRAWEVRRVLEKRLEAELPPEQWARVAVYGQLTLLPISLGIAEAAAEAGVAPGMLLAPQYRTEIGRAVEQAQLLLT